MAMHKDGMTVTATKGKKGTTGKKDIEWWKPASLKEVRDQWAKDSKVGTADEWILKAVHDKIKHRAINFEAGTVRAELEKDGKASQATIKKWQDASKKYRPWHGKQSSTGITQKKAKDIMIKMSKDDPEGFAKLMKAHQS